MEVLMRSVTAFVVVVLIFVIGGVVTGVSNLKDAIFSPKEEKEVVEVQEPKMRESTPAVNPEPVEDYSTQSTGEPEVSYEDEINTATDSDAFTAVMMKISVALNMTTEEEMTAKTEAASGIIATDMEVITNNYIKNSTDYLNVVGVSAEEVSNLIDYILYTSIQGDYEINPDNPSSSVMSVYTQPNGTEIYRIILTVDNNNVDVTMVLNESGFTETLNAAVERIAYARMQDRAKQ